MKNRFYYTDYQKKKYKENLKSLVVLIVLFCVLIALIIISIKSLIGFNQISEEPIQKKEEVQQSIIKSEEKTDNENPPVNEPELETKPVTVENKPTQTTEEIKKSKDNEAKKQVRATRPIQQEYEPVLSLQQQVENYKREAYRQFKLWWYPSEYTAGSVNAYIVITDNGNSAHVEMIQNRNGEAKEIIYRAAKSALPFPSFPEEYTKSEIRFMVSSHGNELRSPEFPNE